MLVTSGLGPTELWDASTGKQISALPTPQAKTGAVAAFDPTGHTLVTASRDGTMQLWDIDPTSWHNRACALAGRRLTEQELERLPPRPPLQALLRIPLTSTAQSRRGCRGMWGHIVSVRFDPGD
jgi:WD40 repeat protein